MGYVCILKYVFHLVRPSSDSITVSWNPPRDQFIKVRSYILGWGNGIPDVYTQVLDDNARYFVIKNLGEYNKF